MKRQHHGKLVTGFSEMMQNFASGLRISSHGDLLLMIDEYERRYDEHQGLIWVQ